MPTRSGSTLSVTKLDFFLDADEAQALATALTR